MTADRGRFGHRVPRRWRLRGWTLVWLLAVGAWLGVSHWVSLDGTWTADWTANRGNTLSPTSVGLLAKMPKPLTITAYLRPDPVRQRLVETLVARYQRHKGDLVFDVVDLTATPEVAREWAIGGAGALVVAYDGRREKVTTLSEAALSQALVRLLRPPRPAYFLNGHGERSPTGQANHDAGLLGAALVRGGFVLEELDLITGAAPALDGVVVVASPRLALLDRELATLLGYLERGGNLLWLMEPAEERNTTLLADYLALAVAPGTVVDPSTASLGLQRTSLIPVVDYGSHPITAGLDAVTLFPTVASLEVQALEPWQITPLLRTGTSAWTELDSEPGESTLDPGAGERRGPLLLGVAMERPWQGATGGGDAARQQRVVVLGDGDFLSNAYLGNGANLDLALNIFNWLTRADTLLDIRLTATPDRQLDLSPQALSWLGMGFFLLLPGLSLAMGAWVWRRRRR